jgi:hypothetical protein
MDSIEFMRQLGRDLKSVSFTGNAIVFHTKEDYIPLIMNDYGLKGSMLILGIEEDGTPEYLWGLVRKEVNAVNRFADKAETV